MFSALSTLWIKCWEEKLSPSSTPRTKLKLHTSRCNCAVPNSMGRNSIVLLADSLLAAEDELGGDTVVAFREHLQSLRSQLGRCFPELDNNSRNPFGDKRHNEHVRPKTGCHLYGQHIWRWLSERKVWQFLFGPHQAWTPWAGWLLCNCWSRFQPPTTEDKATGSKCVEPDIASLMFQHHSSH